MAGGPHEMVGGTPSRCRMTCSRLHARIGH